MKRTLCLPLLAVTLVTTGCAVTYNVPATRTAINRFETQKIPLKVAITVPERGHILSSKTWATFNLPDGELMNDLSEDLFPRVFKKTQIGTFETPPKDVDAIVTLAIQDVNFEQESVGGGFGLRYSTDLTLNCALQDAAGGPIWKQSVKGANRGRAYVSPFIPYEKLMGETFSAALANAFETLGRRLSDSGEIQDFAASRTVETPPVLAGSAAPTPSASRSIDAGNGTDLLKTAFEKGFIKTAQLTRALDELNSPTQSRVLSAFLAGELDSKQFGSIY